MKTLFFMLSDFYDEEVTEREGTIWNAIATTPTSNRWAGIYSVFWPRFPSRPFGPLGPGLILGQIIEAEPVSSGVWRYVRTHFKPAVRSWRLFCKQPDVLNKPDIFQDLQLLRELKCEWEWSVGNITIQTASIEGEPLLSEVERIVDRLVSKAPAGPIACALKSRAQPSATSLKI